MADELTDVIKDLDSLRSGTIKAGIEFKGFTKKITEVAAGTTGASKSWTTFSRLVSGTPLWKVQNQLRAYLSILAGFENRSRANAKAMDKEAKQTIEKIISGSHNLANKQLESYLTYIEKKIPF